MIALVTDSGAQLPPPMRERLGVRVVPLTVVIDGKAFREGVDLSSAEFYGRVRSGASVSTAAPPPGAFVEAWRAAAEDGAEAVASVHTGSNISGTFNAARLAAGDSPIPVQLVDTGTASFPVACCVWEAAEAIASGATLEEVADAARGVAKRVGNVFILGAVDLARRGGRLDPATVNEGDVGVLALEDGAMRSVGAARDAVGAVDAMADYVARWCESRRVRRLRVGIGDAEVPELAADLERRLRSLEVVDETVRYQVGPSVGAHTGPGTVGAVFYEPSVLT
jgi:DegV family protein with EDD domain